MAEAPMRRGFTLIELVVVILLLGILAGVAAPKMFSTTDKAMDNGIRQSLRIVREGIEIFQTANAGRLPGADGNAATFKNDIAPYVRQFPVLPVEPARNASVLMASGGAPAGSATPSEGWKYYYDTGQFIVNSNAATQSDSSVRYDEL
jgi:prepilin-type N-terminal cleavage/methylation domain-containing protein